MMILSTRPEPTVYAVDLHQFEGFSFGGGSGIPTMVRSLAAPYNRVMSHVPEMNDNIKAPDQSSSCRLMFYDSVPMEEHGKTCCCGS